MRVEMTIKDFRRTQEYRDLVASAMHDQSGRCLHCGSRGKLHASMSKRDLILLEEKGIFPERLMMLCEPCARDYRQKQNSLKN